MLCSLDRLLWQCFALHVHDSCAWMCVQMMCMLFSPFRMPNSPLRESGWVWCAKRVSNCRFHASSSSSLCLNAPALLYQRVRRAVPGTANQPPVWHLLQQLLYGCEASQKRRSWAWAPVHVKQILGTFRHRCSAVVPDGRELAYRPAASQLR